MMIDFGQLSSRRKQGSEEEADEGPEVSDEECNPKEPRRSSFWCVLLMFDSHPAGPHRVHSEAARAWQGLVGVS